jgi:hypothetical protein
MTVTASAAGRDRWASPAQQHTLNITQEHDVSEQEHRERTAEIPCKRRARDESSGQRIVVTRLERRGLLDELADGLAHAAMRRE